MLTMAVQPNISTIFNPLTYPLPKLLPLKPFKVSTFSTKLKPSSFQNHLVCKNQGFSTCVSSSEIISDVSVDDIDDDDDVSAIVKQTPKAGAKPTDKPRLVLKFIWMEKNIGLGLDQTVPGHGTIPLSPYYFWPRKDAWEELKLLLESKPWISQKQMIILLNQATDIINLWQQSGGNLPS